jgi:hypothetical protein
MKCPRCDKDINFLEHLNTATIISHASLDAEGGLSYVWIETALWDSGDFQCPECFAELFTDEEEVIEFLSTGKVPSNCSLFE